MVSVAIWFYFYKFLGILIFAETIRKKLQYNYCIKHTSLDYYTNATEQNGYHFETSGSKTKVITINKYHQRKLFLLRPRGPMRWLDPGAFGTLGVGGGFALGAKLCRPDSEVWIIYGDGSLGYSVAEFDTFTRHKVLVTELY